MALTSGTTLGVYRVSELLGKGGMGEVYRARDLKLGRDVAIKVLPSSLAADPDRRARFEREARLLASISHPSIAAIYGVEDSGEATALVLELVEGETLSALIARSRGGLPIVEVVAIARQIADALDAAHERGIVHRDLRSTWRRSARWAGAGCRPVAERNHGGGPMGGRSSSRP
jgi:eukaryotic-like serine/threonine-protein kinase